MKKKLNDIQSKYITQEEMDRKLGLVLPIIVILLLVVILIK